jgi:hypothetical protein
LLPMLLLLLCTSKMIISPLYSARSNSYHRICFQCPPPQPLYPLYTATARSPNCSQSHRVGSFFFISVSWFLFASSKDCGCYVSHE